MSLQQPTSPQSTAADNSASKKNSDLTLLGRYQRNLLFGGGIVLSLVIMVIAAMSAWTRSKDYIAEGRSVFLSHQALLRVEIETKQAALQHDVINAEMLWSDHRLPSENLVRQFAAQHGRIEIRASDKVDPQLALAVLTPDHQAQAYAEYLALTEQQAYVTSTTAIQRARPTTGYYYNPEHTYIAISPTPKANNPIIALDAQNTADLIKRLAINVGDLQNPVVAAHLRTSRNVVWLPPGIGPLTGNEVIKLAQPAFEGDKPFMVFVSDFPASILRNHLSEDTYDGEFVILDQHGVVVLKSSKSGAADDPLVRKLIASGDWRAGFKKLSEHYDDGIFSVSDRLPLTGWVLSYAFSWRTILTALWPQLVFVISMMLLMLAFLWGFVIAFDRRIFMPVFLRSQRTFESENLNRTIIAAAPVGLSLLSAVDGEVLLQNEVMRAYDSKAGGIPLHARFMDVYRANAKSYFDEETPVLLEHELTIALADADQTHLLAKVIQTKYQGRDVLLCTFSDITARQKIEQKLEEARQAADAANSAKSTFLATMSHEIRTPLNAMLGSLELLARSPLSAIQTKWIGIVNMTSDSLLNVISDILDFSKVESGQMSLEQCSFDLAATMQQVVAIFAPMADSKNIYLHLSITPEIARHYRGDPARLQQIVSNLVSNAIKFTATGGVDIHVLATPTPAENDLANVTILVSDTGIGISPASLGKIFDAYTQADTSIHRRFGGTGLGLPLCRRLTTLMGGTITVASTPGIGSTFTVNLPLPVESDVTLIASPLADGSGIRNADENSAIRVLVAEDHPANRMVLQDQLDTLGYQADIVKNGRAALRAFGEKPYDIVLTDLGMPVMDGYTLAACLRDQHTTVPVVAMTAYTTADEHRRCVETGIIDIALKPLSMASLDQILRKYAGHAGRITSIPKEITNNFAEQSQPLSQHVRAVLNLATMQSLTLIQNAITEGDTETVLMQLHSINGGLIMAGELSVAAESARLEQSVREAGLELIKSEWATFEALVCDTLEINK
ncbi:ATP-binding protein [Glaciimonas soli]|uniref:Virulence sensor protein BvgS n=1 Tax=Glaciimonas soli TaxID=2590999 RepID=A0A843YTH1_9BURK|nr:ATP-binding protein [Glaciimonas soli]MQR02510.1 response regulator [Glaciimonas soli]